MTYAELQAVDRALTKAITYLVAMGDTTPYPDDPRWSPWTRFQKPLVDRCRAAREPVRTALNAQ